MRRSTPYSFFMRYSNTSNCSVPTTPTTTSSKPLSGILKIWMAPSCAICSTPLTNCLRFIVSLGDDEHEVLRLERRDAGEAELLARHRDRVADREDAGVKHADDVARVGLVDDLALLRPSSCCG